jgi:hypothetical protein
LRRGVGGGETYPTGMIRLPPKRIPFSRLRAMPIKKKQKAVKE